MAAQVLEEKRPLYSIDRAGTLLEGAFQPVDRSIGLAESGMDLGEVVGRDELARGAIAQLFQDLSCALDIAGQGTSLPKLRQK